MYDIEEIIKTKEERELYLKRWFLYGLFGRHKADEGDNKSAYFYAISSLLSIILISASLYFSIGSYFFEKEITISSFYPMIAGLILHVFIVILWVKDLMKKMKIYEEKLKHLETGEK